jgi:PBSX family phage terminase large subunit
MVTIPLQKFLETARIAGSPQDQVENFIVASHVPLPWQWRFHALAREADKPNGPVDIGTGGARGPGKSHAVMAQAALDDCQRVSRLKGLFLRQTGLAAKESFDDLILKVISGRIPFERVTNSIKFPNGSRIILGGFKTASDIDKYIGIEYDFMIVEELNQLTEDKYTKLRGSLRTSRNDWRPRIYTSFNPGGIGHALVHNRYIREKPNGVEFVGGTYKDNPFLNKEYIEYLESLPGALGRAWREGDFDQFEGQFFREFRRELHTCKPFIPRREIPKYGGVDWGRVAPFVFLAALLDMVELEDGREFHRIWVYKEIDGTDKNPKEWAKAISDKVNLKEFVKIQCDTKMFSPGDDGSISIIDQFKKAFDKLGYSHVPLKKTNKDRISGWSVVHDWLSIAPDGLPYLLITENCVDLINTLPQLVYDENNVEDVNTNGDDHWADALRYMLKHIKWIDAKAGGIHQKEEKKYKQSMITKLDLDAFGRINKGRRRYRQV